MPQESLPLKHYYHVYADGAWEVPINHHIKSLQDSGLYDSLDGFYVGIVGTDENRQLVKEYLNSNVKKFEVVSEKEEGWEQETQDKLYEDAVSSSFKALYAHTKGAANNSHINTAWREIMTEVVVDRWREAVELLDEYDAVGALWLSDGRAKTFSGPTRGKHGFFAGTFWWARSEYLASLGYPKRTCRWDAESWVGETGRVVDNMGATKFMKYPPLRDVKFYDMYYPVQNLTRHFQNRFRNIR